MVEEEPGEGLNASRVAPTVFPLDTFDVLVFELKDGFSLLAKKLVVGGVTTLVLAVSSGTHSTTMYKCQRLNGHTVRCEQDRKTESENYFLLLGQ